MQNNNDYNNDKLEVSLNLNCICTVKDKPYSDIIKKNNKKTHYITLH